MISRPWWQILEEKGSFPDPERTFLFLDLETEGLSKERNAITVVGTYAQDRYRAFVQGVNLHRAAEFLQAFPVWVTFGGTHFDLPFLKKHFPELELPVWHIDLRFLFRRLGYRGGLKKLELEFGLFRKSRGLDGYEAVKLWQRWQRSKDRQALRTLLLYNREDVENLKPLLEIACELCELTGQDLFSTLSPEGGRSCRKRIPSP